MPELLSTKKLFPPVPFPLCWKGSPLQNCPLNPVDPFPESILAIVFWHDEKEGEGEDEDVVIRTAAAATVEHPGVLRASTERTSAKGAEFKELVPVFPDPDKSQDTVDDPLGDLHRPKKEHCYIKKDLKKI